MRVDTQMTSSLLNRKSLSYIYGTLLQDEYMALFIAPDGLGMVLQLRFGWEESPRIRKEAH